MNQILTLREKRAKAWDAAKAFLDTKRGTDGMLSAEDAATYDKMEADVVTLGKEVERLERQSALDLELSKPTAAPLTGKPDAPTGKTKTGRATDEYKAAFWQVMRNKSVSHEVYNALKIGEDDHGGFLAPDEFQRTLIEALQEQNIFRGLAKVITTSSGDRKIPVVASKGSASACESKALPLSAKARRGCTVTWRAAGRLLMKGTASCRPRTCCTRSTVRSSKSMRPSFRAML